MRSPWIGYSLAAAGGAALLLLGVVLGTGSLLASGSAAVESPDEFETKVEVALGAAEAALASEEARLDELAARHSRRALPGGRPSLGQAAANIRLWEQQIRELDADERELRQELGGLLKSLGPDIAQLARHLSAQREQAEHEQAKRKQAARQAREKVDRGKAEKGRTEPGQVERKKADVGVGRVFRDCEGCPEMVMVPSGKFKMGSPASEKGRGKNEGPTHLVTIGYRFAVGVREVTRGEFGRFVSATNRVMGKSCWTWEGEWRKGSGVGWRNPGFSQEDDHPVVCVSWNDAKAYVRWLSKQTGKRYRLLSEAEWEYVARAGTTTSRYWGPRSSDQCRHANGADASASFGKRAECDDGYAQTAPVGSFDANGFGLRDILGNVWEWVEDCWNPGYRGAPLDGGAWKRGDCDRRVFRGGSWSNEPGVVRSAFRIRYRTGFRSNVLGFRVARTHTP